MASEIEVTRINEKFSDYSYGYSESPGEGGGYHQVALGDVLNKRYRVLRKLGQGHFSEVWKCWDMKGQRRVALKIVKSAKPYMEAAIDEISLLRCVQKTDALNPMRERIVKLLDSFTVSGANGLHMVMVMEPLGCNLLKLIQESHYHGLTLGQVRLIVREVLEGLQYLHEKCHIIHTDIKPENVVVVLDNGQKDSGVDVKAGKEKMMEVRSHLHTGLNHRQTTRPRNPN